jgi:hypothetical protein
MLTRTRSVIFAIALTAAWGQNPKEVITQHNDNLRTGAYTGESFLTPLNVRPSTFGKLNFSIAVDGQIYAQPLYIQVVQRPDGAKNAVIVATENNQLYAFDADSGTQLWRTGPEKFGQPVDAPTNNQGAPCRDIRSKIGITASPAIDPQPGANRKIYLVSKTIFQGQIVYNLHAVNANTGAVVQTIKIQSSDPKLPFNAAKELNRAGLLLSDGVVYVAFGAHCDYQPYHGFVFAYTAANFSPAGVYCSTCATPQSNGGGIWQAGNGVAADEQGSVYFMTGNGTNGPGDFCDSFIKLRRRNGGLEVQNTFTAPNPKFLTSCDLDLGSSGPLLLPQDRVVGGGKEGTFYVLSRALAQQQQFQGTFDQYEGPTQDPNNQCAVDGQLLSHVQASRPHIHGSPVLRANAHGSDSRVYVWGEKDFLRGYTYRNGGFDTNQVLQSQEKLQNGSMPGGILSLSSSGNTNAILWAAHPIKSCSDRTSSADANEGPQPGILIAFDADNLQHVLWDSCMNEGRDGFGGNGKLAKFVPPTVANGKVYMAIWDLSNVAGNVVKGRILVYGKLQ